MDEYLVAGYAGGAGEDDEVVEESFDNAIDALEFCSMQSTWTSAAFILLWRNGDCVATFYSHDEAMEAMLAAVGRC